MTRIAPLPPPPAPTLPEPAARRVWLRRIAPFAALIGVFAFFAALRWQRFTTVDNLRIIALSTAVVGTAAMGMTLVIISAGIDLSVGSAVALITIVIARLMTDYHLGPLPAIVGAIAAGALCGLLIGTLITQLRLVPFIVTLATWTFYRGLAIQISANHGNPISPEPTWLNGLMVGLLRRDQNWMLVAPGVWVMLVLALLVAGLLRYTRLGRHIFAVGSNEQTARLCGVNVNRTKILVYTLAGAFTGVAGVLQFAKLGEGDPTTAAGMELSVIAAVVIGGGSLNGGEGSVAGTLIGALIMSILANGCAKMGYSDAQQMMITGVIIVLACGLDRLRHGRSGLIA